MSKKAKNLIVVLSDIHIGTNAPTVWYQKNLHESYLTSVLDYVISNAQWIRELILLGDVVDFWTYPHDQKPPSFDDIKAANPEIFDKNGKLSQALTALEGKVTYVRGNHDITITQQDLDKIENPQGYQIKLSPDDIYFPLGKDNKKIVCTHGHIYTIFNAPYNSSRNRIAPIPLGYFITRSVASLRSRQLKSNQTVAQLPDSGDPSGYETIPALAEIISDVLPTNITDLLIGILSGSTKNSWNILTSLAKLVLSTIARVTGVGENQPIQLADGTSITIAEAEGIYENLFSEWEKNENSFVTAYKSAIADLNGTYMGWFAQKLAFEIGADLVVMGHTHQPISRLAESLIKYVNTGFNCPSELDIGKKHPTFIEIDIEQCEAGVRQVVKNENSYSIGVYPTQVDSVIAKSVSGDFSCYIIIDNEAGDYELHLEEYQVDEGIYVTVPPEEIGFEKARFWLQDKPGLNGAKGSVKYSYKSNQGIRKEIILKYGCPFTANNYCSGGKFFTKIGDNVWSNPNEVKTSGHPFFVKFVL